MFDIKSKIFPMISDLGKELTYSTVSKYADDTKNKAKVSNQKDTENI